MTRGESGFHCWCRMTLELLDSAAQATSEPGSGNVIISIQGNGNSVVAGLPHLELTQRPTLAYRVHADAVTEKLCDLVVLCSWM